MKRDPGNPSHNTRSFFDRIFSLIRWDDWSKVRIPFIFSALLYLQYTDRVLGEGIEAYVRFFSAVFFAICYYIFLFLVNDLFDYEQDVKSKNKDASRDKGVMIASSLLVLIIGISTAILSWRVISIEKLMILFISYFFVYFYSAFPYRYKEKGFLGIIVGSLILRPVSVFLVTMDYLQNTHFLYIFSYLIWLEIFSIRSMLFHQLDDFKSDKLAGVRTYVIEKGASHSMKLIANVYLPAEILSHILLSCLIAIRTPVLGGILFIVTIISGYKFIKEHSFFALRISHYRPLLGTVHFFFLPVCLAFAVAIRDSLWYIPLFVVYWQRAFLRESLRKLVSF